MCVLKQRQLTQVRKGSQQATAVSCRQTMWLHISLDSGSNLREESVTTIMWLPTTTQ